MNSGKFTGGSNNKCYPNFILQSLDKMLIMNLEFVSGKSLGGLGREIEVKVT